MGLKKLTALFLLFLFLFNLFGYRILVQYVQQQSDKLFEQTLDRNSYDDTQLIELKIPVSMPYQTSWSGYERYDGEINVKGAIYKYVKRKVANDTLYVMCIPNIKKMRLESAKDDFFKITNDIKNKNSKKSGPSKEGSFKNLQTEYDGDSVYTNYFPKSASIPRCWLSAQIPYTLSAHHLSIEQPPDSKRA